MKPLIKNPALWVCFCFLLVGCSEKPKSDPGVQVGNGVRSYYSEEYKFKLEYADTYKLQEKSPEKFQLVNTHGKQAHFQAFKDGKIEGHVIQTEQGLVNFLKTKRQNESFTKASNPKLTAYHSEKSLFIFTPKEDVVLIKKDEGALSISLDEIERNIYFNTSPPVPTKVTALNVNSSNGRLLVVQLEIENKNVDLTSTTFGKVKTLSPPPIPNCLPELDVSFFIQKTSPNSYKFKAYLPHNLCSGPFILQRLVVSDRLGNGTLLHAHKKLNTAFYYQNIPAALFEVSPYDNVARDFNIDSIKITKPTLNAGDTQELRFTLDPKDAAIALFQDNWGTLVPSSKLPWRRKFIALGGELRFENEEYVLPIELNKFSPAGDYSINLFKIIGFDGSLKRYALNNLSFKVLENPMQDIVPPTLEALQLQPAPLAKNSMGEIYFKANDDFSTIKDGAAFWGVMLRRPFLGAAVDPLKRFHLTGIATRLKDGWYRLEFWIPEETDPGIYALQLFSIQDRAGNFLTIQADEKFKFYTPHPLPVLNIQIKDSNDTLALSSVVASSSLF